MSLTQGLHRTLLQAPDRLATVCQGRRHSVRVFGNRVMRLAGALQQLGMGSANRVAMLSLNSDRYLEYYFAVWWGGGVVNPINTRWNAAEIAYSLDDCDTRILIVDDTFAPMIEELRARSSSLRWVIHASDGDQAAGAIAYENIVSDNEGIPDICRGGDDLAGIFYTGGTTGAPKGVMISHASLTANALTLCAEGLAPKGSIGIHVAPMFHLADGAFTMALSLRGGTNVFLPAFDPRCILKMVEDERVTTIALVPTMIQRLMDQLPESPQGLNSLQQIFYAGSPISEALLRRVRQDLPWVGLIQAYGMTEMSPVVSILGADEHEGERLLSAGFPTLHVEARIVDADGRERPRGMVGEIVARGSGMMQGYWNKPAETAAAIRDGWFHTGDCAYMDEAGCIFVVDRLKDMIVSGGENVYSAEVENAVTTHPAVSACAVIGIPSPEWGEAVHAIVVLRRGHAANEESIRAHCKALISSYKCPRSVEFRTALPLSGAGKVLKNQLRDPFWNGQSRAIG